MIRENSIHGAASSEKLNRCVFLAGPTASGKSDIALALAERIGGEIISVDSMQVYRGLDIGTAKPDAALRKRVRHHLIDVAGLAEFFDAAQFVRLARQAVEDIHARGRAAIFCGGTGLYFKAFLEGLGEAPAADPALRAELEALPMSTLLAELKECDPAAYEKIDRENPRRIIRAVEVIRLTGKPFSAQRSNWEVKPSGLKKGVLYGFNRDSKDLHQRIETRVDQMFRQGLVEEARELLDQGLARNRTAMQAIGYRQVVEHLEGRLTLPETVELVKIRTRQFARRQMTWFRRQLPLQWVQCQPGDRPELIAASLCEMLHSGRSSPG